jgi:hypothetical protein
MVELESKPHLMSEYCVARRIEMLTYFVYAPLSTRRTALMHTLI